LPEFAPEPITETARRIGEHVAGLIQDECILQLGIGAIPNAVLAALANHRDLGIHTEMFSDGVVNLVEADVIRNARKTLHRGKTVSRITIDLAPGSGVTTSRNDVHYVVTEFGVAPLHGKTLRDRVHALVGVAHPTFREELLAGARGRRWI
jgi:acyl-CoA hydrolase